MHPAKQGIVESGEDLSIMLILQAGWQLQREPPAIPAGSPLADGNTLLSSFGSFSPVLL